VPCPPSDTGVERLTPHVHSHCAQAQRRAGGMDEEDDEMGEGDEEHALGAMAAKAASRAAHFDTAAADRARRTAAAGVSDGAGTSLTRAISFCARLRCL
jgi:hypothetical protein